MRAVLAAGFLIILGCAVGSVEDEPQCGDGLDNDGDGRVDLDDFGCTNAVDEDETDTPRCGDGVINREAEECDGQDLGGQDCRDIGFAGGVLQCAPNCLFGTAACVVSSQCDNADDDDNDGFVDASDPGCTGGADLEEFFSAESCGGVGGPVFDLTLSGARDVEGLGATFGAVNNFAPTDTENGCTTATGGELVLSYRLFEARRVRFSTDQGATDFDTVLYVRSFDCLQGTERCSDDISGNNLRSSLTLDLPAGDHFIFVDGFNGATGNFSLLIDVQ